jgi:hypothetical protein
MKTTIAFLLALSTGLAVNASAIADQFNDRGPEFGTGVSPSPYSGPATTSSHGFNGRGEDFVANVRSTTDGSRQTVRVVSHGFNDRGAGYTAPGAAHTSGNALATVH